jgi:hypothetical protein
MFTFSYAFQIIQDYDIKTILVLLSVCETWCPTLIKNILSTAQETPSAVQMVTKFHAFTFLTKQFKLRIRNTMTVDHAPFTQSVFSLFYGSDFVLDDVV